MITVISGEVRALSLSFFLSLTAVAGGCRALFYFSAGRLGTHETTTPVAPGIELERDIR